MRKLLLLIPFFAIAFGAGAQKVEGFVFNLYTDSLKKGFYNYISVDGKLSDDTWMPLDSTHLKFTANTGHFMGNDLFIDSSYSGDSVKVRAQLRSNPKVWKEVVIYIRKRPFDEPLKTDEEILQEMRGKKKKSLP